MQGKSGGHGVGWSEMPRYTFKVPPGWEETPVSIADLGGTEVRQLSVKRVHTSVTNTQERGTFHAACPAAGVGAISASAAVFCSICAEGCLPCCCCSQIDLRFACPEQGNLQVVVAPVLRFADVGYNAGESVVQLLIGNAQPGGALAACSVVASCQQAPAAVAALLVMRVLAAQPSCA
jgi:hypothetical protein